MGITRFILKRLALSVLTLLVLTLAIFYTSTFFSPSERAAMYVSRGASGEFKDPNYLMVLAQKLGFTDPFYIQYINWLRATLITGNLGYSYTTAGFVTDVIMRYLPPTLEIVMFSAPIIFIGGIRVGEYAARRAFRKGGSDDPIDSTIRASTALAYSIPVFFTGLLSLSIFFLNLHWFAPGRLGSGTELFVRNSAIAGSWHYYTRMYTIDALLNGQFGVFLDALRHLVLPVTTLTISVMPVVVKVTRSSMLLEFDRPYVTAALAKGLTEIEVVGRVKRNAMISILTVSSVLFANMLTGIIVTESVFSVQGIGSLAIYAAKGVDFALLVGLSVFFCILFVFVNLLVDVMYTRLDPRIKL